MINSNKIIEKLKEHIGVHTDENLSKYLGIHQSTLSGWRKRNTINIELIIEKIDDVDMNWLLYEHDIEKSNNDYSKVKPRISKIKDEGIEYLHDQEIEDILNIEVYDVPAYGSETGLVNMEEYPHSTKKLYIGMKIAPKFLKGVRVIGNSMEGSGINNNDYVLYRTDDKAYNNRQVLANLNGALIVKTLKKENGGIVLYSDYSDQSKPIPVGDDDNLNIIGIVVAVISYR